MIFVTVGTHEQSFNRLIECVDELKRKGSISEKVIIQSGFSTYEPRYCEWKKFYPYSQMQQMYKEARIVITHGGPSSFIVPLQMGKVPIVVPRQVKFQEHVNEHQVTFVNLDLESKIMNFDSILAESTGNSLNNNEKFISEFKKIVDGMFERA